ncbi:MAG TPA: hypothetical protein VFQ61_16270 [Polyangiaceae bacterium]|nr:hypothetical protein [Polyangiaceae bacterium]
MQRQSGRTDLSVAAALGPARLLGGRGAAIREPLSCGSGGLGMDLVVWFLRRTPDLGTLVLGPPQLCFGIDVNLPNADQAIIPLEKVRDYLLSAANPRARGKAAFFQTLGFDPVQWEVLRDALLEVARTGDASPGQRSEFGTKYEIRATICGPTGRRAVIRTVWIVNAGEDRPRFITGYPD